jgi:hypothetical protein
LHANDVPTRILVDGPDPQLSVWAAQSIDETEALDEIVIRSKCRVGELERRIRKTCAPDRFDIKVKLVLDDTAAVRSVEDRFTFAPPRRDSQTPLSAPLDFIWSQDIKSEADDLIPQWSFKSLAVMFQQGKVFAALIPDPGTRKVPLTMDLDVTSDSRPWFFYGAVIFTPHGHSYFCRSAREICATPTARRLSIHVSVVASAQPVRLGYRSVVTRSYCTTLRKTIMKQAM